MSYKNKINYPNLTVFSSSSTLRIFYCFSQFFPCYDISDFIPLSSISEKYRPTSKEKNIKNYNIIFSYFKIIKGERRGK